MSWLSPRRPKKTHPWPPNDSRWLDVRPMSAADVLAMLTFARPDARDGGYLIPVPQTAEELRAAGMTYIGSGKP